MQKLSKDMAIGEIFSVEVAGIKKNNQVVDIVIDSDGNVIVYSKEVAK